MGWMAASFVGCAVLLFCTCRLLWLERVLRRVWWGQDGGLQGDGWVGSVIVAMWAAGAAHVCSSHACNWCTCVRQGHAPVRVMFGRAQAVGVVSCWARCFVDKTVLVVAAVCQLLSGMHSVLTCRVLP